MLLASWCATANAEHQRFRTFTGEDGLSQLSVRAMVQDQQGYLWIATESGLNRFDGRHFEVFGAKDGLSHSQISALAIGPSGALWIGTPVGVDRLRDGRFETFGRDHGLAPTHVHAIALARDGAVACGTADGLTTLRAGRFEYAPELKGRGISSLARGRDGRLWVGTADAGLWVRGDDGVRRVKSLPAEAAISALAAGPDQRIYAGFEGGVYVLEGEQLHSRIDVGGESRPTVYALHVDQQGALWIGDELGLSRRAADGQRRFGPNDRLRITNVTAVVEDADG